MKKKSEFLFPEKFDIAVQVNQYASVKDGRTIFIDEIIEYGKLYRGRDINAEGMPVVELKHEEILCLAEEVCKNVTVEYNVNCNSRILER